MTTEKTPDAEKPWYESKTIIGAVVAVGSGLAAAFGIVLAPEDQSAIVDVVVALGASVGGLLAIYGRVKAKTTLRK